MKKVWRRMVSWMAAVSICMTSMGSAVTVKAVEMESDPVFAVVTDNCEHGMVKLDKENGSYLAGEKVHVTLTPEEGYTLSGITVYTESEQTVETEEEKTGISFSMPTEHVRLSAVFSKETEVATEAGTNAVTKSETEAATERVGKTENETAADPKLETGMATEKDKESEKKR